MRRTTGTALDRARAALDELEREMAALRQEIEAMQPKRNAGGGLVRTVPAQRLGRSVARSVFDLGSLLPGDPSS